MLSFPDTVTAPRLIMIFELTMASFGARNVPSIFLEKPDNLLHLHHADNRCFPRIGKAC